MASDPDDDSSAFLPPLSALFSGSSRLISFETAHRSLSTSPEFARDCDSLEQFCFDKQAYSLLLLCPDGLPKPTAHSKADFEARTAPIQVSGSQNGDYNLEEMKKDALELSAQLAIEETLALRIVCLEWQSRAEEQFLRGGDDVRKAESLSASVVGKSLRGLNGSVNGAAKPSVDFSDEPSRRRRQLGIYLQERSSRLKLATDLLGCHTTRDESDENATWSISLARQFYNERLKTDNAAEHVTNNLFGECMTAMEEQLQVLDDTTKLPKMAQESEDMTLMYAAATFNDIVTIMRLMLLALQIRTNPPTSRMVTSWFQKLESVNYFLALTPSPAWPDTTELQCLVSLISFAILDVRASTPQLEEALGAQSKGTVSYPRLDKEAYFEDEACLSEVSLILYRAAINDISIMVPAIFAWATVTSVIRDAAQIHNERRERMLEDGSSDNETYARRRASRRDSKEDMSLAEKLFAALQNMEMEPEVKEDPTMWFAAYSEPPFFDIAAQLSVSVSSAYVSELELPTQYIARTHLLHLLRGGLRLTMYGAPMVEAILAILTPQHPIDSAACNTIDSRISSDLISDELFHEEILTPALMRYPIELSPMLRLLGALATRVSTLHELLQMLESLRAMTIMVPSSFGAYTLENEDENSNEIRTTRDIPLFVSRQALSRFGADHVGRRALTEGNGEDSDRGIRVTSLPSGTLGTVLREEKPMIIKMEHAHSGLEYLGMLLSTRLPNAEMCVTSYQPELDLATAADIVALITALLKASLKRPRGEFEAKSILERLSDALPVEKDIVSVLAELFESELIAHLDQTAQDGSLDLLVACADLLAVLVNVDPGKIWAILAQSSLLGLNGGSNALAAVVGANETALGQFRFLSACTLLYNNLVDDAVGGLVKRRPKEQPVRRGRFDSPVERSEYTPERTMQRVLNAVTGVMLEAWESLGEWRFAVPAEKAGIATRICSSFSMLLRSTYGLQNDPALSDEKDERRRKEARLASLLFPAADAVLDFFAPHTKSTTSVRSFSAAFAGAAMALSGGSSTIDTSSQDRLTETATTFLQSLLRTSRTAVEDGERAYAVATQLLKSMPDLLIIFTTEPALKGPVASLLTEVTISLHRAPDQADPPSLLSHLPTSSAKAFLSVLAYADRRLCDRVAERRLWDFLSTMMSSRQQWIALYLLTGTAPRDRLDQAGGKAETNGKSLLTYALDDLCALESMSLERSTVLLGFVSAAQGAWVWASSKVRSHSGFLTSIMDWLNSLNHSAALGSPGEQLLRAKEAKKASLVCETLAQAVHASAEVGDKTILQMLTKKLNFLSENAQRVDAYNLSLHKNVAENVRKHLSSVELDVFKRSVANPAEEYGKSWTYDVEIMDQALAHEHFWIGRKARNGTTTGFRDEVARANINLSLVSAQTTLLKAWSALAATVVEGLGLVDEPTRTDLSTHLATAARKCLEANETANLEIPDSDKVIMIRAEMSFVLFSKLASGSPSQELRAILPAAYRAVMCSPADFEVATQEEDLRYYRLGLQIVFLAVQPHVQSAKKSSTSAPSKPGDVKATDETPISFLDPAIAGVLMDVVTRIVSRAWRALAGNLHTNVACALPGDFALLVTLLKAVLSVPGIATVHTQIAEVTASMQLVRSALSLYSWADQLAEGMDGDPVHGELAVQFLQVLSTVPPIAEHIALEGALAQLSSANLSSYFRKPGGKGPFDEPRRMFTIWTEGMLPLCLNLLDAVGPPVAADVSNFLNGFPLQLQRANTALQNREATKFNPHAGAITLGVVHEAHSLCLISMILQSDTARAAAEGIDAMSIGGGLQGYEHERVLEDAAGLVRQKALLASRITLANGVEAAWAGRMVDGVDSWLSARIIREVKTLASMGPEEGAGAESS